MKNVEPSSFINFFTEDGCLPIVRTMVTRCKADVNAIGAHGYSELGFAVAKGHIDVAEYFLQIGADVNRGEVHPLTEAAEQGNLRMVELLLNHRANPNGNVSHGKTPLIVAAARGHREVIKLLLDRGAAKNNMALVGAVRQGQATIVKLLLDRGFHANHLLIILAPRMSSDTVLNVAVTRGNVEIAKLLLDRGAEVNDGRSCPNGHAIFEAIVNKNGKMIQLLLDYGADVNVRCQGETPVSLAVRQCGIRVSAILVKHMCLIKAKGHYVSEENLNVAKVNEKIANFQCKCESEIEMLKSEKFDDSNLRYFDVFEVRVDKLAALARNEKIVKSVVFKRKFPTYGKVIVELFKRGVRRNKDFDFFKKFVDQLSSRGGVNKLPKLPHSVVCELFDYLDDKDVLVLRDV